jgi:hypothetical protein
MMKFMRTLDRETLPARWRRRKSLIGRVLFEETGEQNILPLNARKPLKRPDSNERIQGNPSKSKPGIQGKPAAHAAKQTWLQDFPNCQHPGSEGGPPGRSDGMTYLFRILFAAGDLRNVPAGPIIAGGGAAQRPTNALARRAALRLSDRIGLLWHSLGFQGSGRARMRHISLIGLLLTLSGCALERNVTFVYYPNPPHSATFPPQSQFAADAQAECARYGLVAVHEWDNWTTFQRIRSSWKCVQR